MTPQKTPLMKQYDEMKSKHPDAVLLFRVGDFYETFREDAITASQILGITLTRRAMLSGTMELAGFPHHALDTYLPRLIRAGKRVAICEQMEDPKQAHPKVKKMLDEVKPAVKLAPQEKSFDISTLVSLLTMYRDILRKLCLYEEMKLKTQEFRAICAELKIPAKKAFEECIIINQPSLFD